MKLKTLLTTVVALAFGATAAFADEDTPLSKEMSAMNKALRTLKRQAADPAKKADNLALVATMKEKTAAALKYEPAKTKDQPAGDKAAYLEKYKKQMADLDKAIDELKAAIDSGNADAAQKVFEKLADIKEKGHKDFGADE
jgi:soluble cytochrome b562